MIFLLLLVEVLGRMVNIQYAYDDDYFITLLDKKDNPRVRLARKGSKKFLKGDINIEIESEFTKLKFGEYTYLCGNDDGRVITCMASNTNILYQIIYIGEYVRLKTNSDLCLQKGHKINSDEYALVLRNCDSNSHSQRFTITDSYKNTPHRRLYDTQSQEINKFFTWHGRYCINHNNRDSLYRDF